MTHVPEAVATFLSGRRFAVAGVSRRSTEAANAVYRRLSTAGYEVVPVNPQASAVEGVPCFPDVASVPGRLDGVVVVTHPDAALAVVRQCAERGVGRVWFHRSVGKGSVSEEAVRECRARGIACIVGGCPLMYCQPVDGFHRCLRWWLAHFGRIEG